MKTPILDLKLEAIRELSGFRTRISNLKAKFVPIESSKLTSTNKYGRTYSFAMHRLMDKQKAIDLYEKLNGGDSNIRLAES